MKKDCFYAQCAMLLAIGFWIPLINIGLATTSLVLAVKALQLTDKDPKQYGGRKRAVTAIALSVTAIILTVIGLIIYLLRKFNGCLVLP